MRKICIDKNIKCDTVLCNNTANIMIETDSYKGNSFLCKSCFNNFKSLFKKDIKND